MIDILDSALSLNGKDGCLPPESTSSVHIETCLGILWKGGLLHGFSTTKFILYIWNFQLNCQYIIYSI